MRFEFPIKVLNLFVNFLILNKSGHEIVTDNVLHLHRCWRLNF